MRMGSSKRILYTQVCLQGFIVHRQRLSIAYVDGYPSGGNRWC